MTIPGLSETSEEVRTAWGRLSECPVAAPALGALARTVTGVKPLTDALVDAGYAGGINLESMQLAWRPGLTVDEQVVVLAHEARHAEQMSKGLFDMRDVTPPLTAFRMTRLLEADAETFSCVAAAAADVGKPGPWSAAQRSLGAYDVRLEGLPGSVLGHGRAGAMVEINRKLLRSQAFSDAYIDSHMVRSTRVAFNIADHGELLDGRSYRETYKALAPRRLFRWNRPEAPDPERLVGDFIRRLDDLGVDGVHVGRHCNWTGLSYPPRLSKDRIDALLMAESAVFEKLPSLQHAAKFAGVER